MLCYSIVSCLRSILTIHYIMLRTLNAENSPNSNIFTYGSRSNFYSFEADHVSFGKHDRNPSIK